MRRKDSYAKKCSFLRGVLRDQNKPYRSNTEKEFQCTIHFMGVLHTYIFLIPIILTQEPQKHRNSLKSLI